jgi:8-oxo-dGTP diphosphatase
VSTDITRKQRVVVAAFLHDRDEVLLARRAATKRIAPGKSHLPGGHVEFGEHPADALARELREELAIDVAVGEPLWVFHYPFEDSHTVGIVFRVPLPGTREALRWDSTDLETCYWVKEIDLGKYLERGDHNYLAALAGFAQLRRAELGPS